VGLLPGRGRASSRDGHRFGHLEPRSLLPRQDRVLARPGRARRSEVPRLPVSAGRRPGPPRLLSRHRFPFSRRRQPDRRGAPRRRRSRGPRSPGRGSGPCRPRDVARRELLRPRPIDAAHASVRERARGATGPRPAGVGVVGGRPLGRRAPSTSAPRPRGGGTDGEDGAGPVPAGRLSSGASGPGRGRPPSVPLPPRVRRERGDRGVELPSAEPGEAGRPRDDHPRRRRAVPRDDPPGHRLRRDVDTSDAARRKGRCRPRRDRPSELGPAREAAHRPRPASRSPVGGGRTLPDAPSPRSGGRLRGGARPRVPSRVIPGSTMCASSTPGAA